MRVQKEVRGGSKIVEMGWRRFKPSENRGKRQYERITSRVKEHKVT